jgi:hypothetical protein
MKALHYLTGMTQDSLMLDFIALLILELCCDIS